MVGEPWYVPIFHRLGDLVTEVPPLRDSLDLAIGAAASFMRAEQLGYQDRDFALPDDYYEKLRERHRMAEGTLPPHGRWISGYYFNSGLIRLSEARKQLRGHLRRAVRFGAVGVPELAPDADFTEEADRLKHDARGLSERRRVTFDAAISMLGEFVTVIDNAKSALATLPPPPQRRSARRRKRRGTPVNNRVEHEPVFDEVAAR